MKPVVLLSHPMHPEVIRDELAPRAKVVLRETRRGLEREIGRADALLVYLSDTVDDALLSRARRLRVVGNFAVGVNNIDLAACARRGIRVVNTPGVLTRATAELAVALMLAAARRLREAQALCSSGGFRGWKPDLLLGLELRGRRALVVGKGRIGRETAKIFDALGLRVEFVTRGDSPSGINRKLRRAQVLSLHLPLTSETRHWLDERRIALLPPDAIVVNTSRGAVIDERALARALASRRIFAAGLDVFEREPAIPPALRRLPNAILAPHVGSATRETRAAMARLMVRGVLAILRGEDPPNEVSTGPDCG